MWRMKNMTEENILGYKRKTKCKNRGMKIKY